VEDVKARPDGRRVIYSNFIDSGIVPLEAALQDAKVPYGRFTGSDNKKTRDEYIRQFNKGNLNNLIISSAGAEGLDLKGVREVHVMEPHWNEQKLRQVIARARRYKSHAHLPEDERNVTVKRYISQMPQRGPANMVRRLTGKPLKMQDSAEAYIQARSMDKQKLNLQM
jgi:superfamily II DNA/RNA helicase